MQSEIVPIPNENNNIHRFYKNLNKRLHFCPILLNVGGYAKAQAGCNKIG
jgi:hypothetical protein